MLRAALREPLLHFAVLGSAVFMLYRALHPVEDASRVIRIDEPKRAELVLLFEQKFKRRPLASELDGMVAQYVQSELLFREGVALDLDKNDATMREMVISKARASIQSKFSVPEPNDAQLSAFYAAHREQYDLPERVSFEQYLVNTDEHGESAARALQERLERGDEVDDWAHTTLEMRTAKQVELVFGAQLAQDLFALADERWHTLNSPRGHHVLRILRREAKQDVPLASVRERAILDYRNSARQERYHSTLEQLLSRYDVQVEAP